MFPICAIGSSYALRILVQWIIDFLFMNCFYGSMAVETCMQSQFLEFHWGILQTFQSDNSKQMCQTAVT